MSTTTVAPPRSPRPELSVRRLNLMRAGYAFMGFGLVVVKWPLLPEAQSQPLFEGVVTCLLVAMSVLALLGLRYPVKVLPVLLFESLWKLLWLGAVALPAAATGSLDEATRQVMVNCLLVSVVLAVIPWRYVWGDYVMAPGDRWR